MWQVFIAESGPAAEGPVVHGCVAIPADRHRDALAEIRAAKAVSTAISGGLRRTDDVMEHWWATGWPPTSTLIDPTFRPMRRVAQRLEQTLLTGPFRAGFVVARQPEHPWFLDRPGARMAAIKQVCTLAKVTPPLSDGVLLRPDAAIVGDYRMRRRANRRFSATVQVGQPMWWPHHPGTSDGNPVRVSDKVAGQHWMPAGAAKQDFDADLTYLVRWAARRMRYAITHQRHDLAVQLGRRSMAFDRVVVATRNPRRL